MCNCKNIYIGNYKRQVSMKDPFNTRNRNDGWVCIDICICQEIAELWNNGIRTIESCCGHNTKDGYIITLIEDKEKMMRLGYTRHKQWDHSEKTLTCFYPLSHFSTPHRKTTRWGTVLIDCVIIIASVWSGWWLLLLLLCVTGRYEK